MTEPQSQTHSDLSEQERAELEQEKQQAQAEIDSLKEQIKEHENAPAEIDPVQELQAEVAELKDQLLRTVAEAENTKKRAAIDAQKSRDFAIESFAKDIINVLDHLYRASESISDEMLEQSPVLQSVKEGVEITKNEMIKAFERHNLKRLNPEGEAFDHNYHQAMAQVEDNTLNANTIVQVIQAGYTLKERLLRPALVNVSKKAAPNADA